MSHLGFLRRGWRALALACLLPACTVIDYGAAPAGRFEGAVFVMWVGEGEGQLGDGRFVYVPVPGQELTFHRARPDATLEVIRPGRMYTDGGSIPRVVQPFRGFNPWGYAPAYMVHDWLFVARKCLNDGAATEAEQAVAGMSFRESAEVLAEAIKTLIAERRVSPNDVAPQAISSATATPVAQRFWEAEGTCAAQRLSPEHEAQVDALLRRERGLSAPSPVPGVPPARLVSVIEF